MVDHAQAIKTAYRVNDLQRCTIATIESMAGSGVNSLAPGAFHRGNMFLVLFRQLLVQLLSQAENLIVAGLVVHTPLHTGHLHETFHEVSLEAIL